MPRAAQRARQGPTRRVRGWCGGEARWWGRSRCQRLPRETLGLPCSPLTMRSARERLRHGPAASSRPGGVSGGE